LDSWIVVYEFKEIKHGAIQAQHSTGFVWRYLFDVDCVQCGEKVVHGADVARVDGRQVTGRARGTTLHTRYTLSNIINCDPSYLFVQFVV